MSGANTSGYDLVVQLSRSSLDQGLARFAGAFPRVIGPVEITLPIKNPLPPFNSLGSAKYDAVVELALPTLPSLQPLAPPAAGGRVSLRSGFTGRSGLTLKVGILGIPLDFGVELTLAGSASMGCDLAIETVTPPGGPVAGRSVVAKLGTATVAFQVTGELKLGTIGNVPIKVDSATLQTALAPVLTLLRTALAAAGSLPLTWPIPLNTGPTSATRVTAIDFSAFQGSPEGLALGVLSGCGGTGNASGLRTNPGAVPPARLLAANSWLVCFTADIVQTALGLPGSFVSSGGGSTRTWTGSVGITAPTGEIFTLTSLIIDVPPGGPGIRVRGSGFASGFCWTATPAFTSTITFTCGPGGVLTPSVATSATSNVSVPWGCIVGAIVLTIIAGAILPVIGAIVVGIISGIVLSLAGAANPVAAATAALNTLLGLPLPVPIASIGIPCGLVVFDDLEVSGTPLYADLVPTRSAGRTLLPAGATFDLDGGAVTSGSARDLSWTGSAVQTAQGTRLTLTQGGFGDVTLRRLQHLGYGATSVAAGAIPATGTAPLVFGARTSDGLYARCAVSRTGSALDLQWVTYDSPASRITIELTATVTDSESVSSGTETCSWIEIEPGPSINQLEDSVGAILGGGQPPWNPDAEGGGVPPGTDDSPGGYTPIPDGGLGGGYNLPTVADVLEDRRNRPTVRVTPHHETVSYEVTRRAQRVVCRARPELVTYPATFAWTAFGQAIPAQSGTTQVAGLDVTFDEQEPTTLVIESPLGVTIAGKVICLAVDPDGREVTGTATLSYPGQSRTGGCGRGPGGGFGSLFELALAGNELGATVANARTAARTMRAAVALAAPPEAQARPMRFTEALRAAPARRKVVRGDG